MSNALMQNAASALAGTDSNTKALNNLLKSSKGRPSELNMMGSILVG